MTERALQSRNRQSRNRQPRAPQSGTRRPRTLRPRLARWLWRTRYLLASACVGLAVAGTIQALSPSPPATRDVVVPTRRIEAGAVIEKSDLTVLAVAVELAPELAVASINEAVGATAVIPLAAKMPFAAEMISGGEVAASAPPGTVVVPVRLGEATGALLAAGDRVDLVSTVWGESEAVFIARRALVLPSAQRAPTRSGGLLGGSGDNPTAGVSLIAVRPSEAAAVASAAATGSIGAVIVP